MEQAKSLWESFTKGGMSQKVAEKRKKEQE